MSLPSSEPYWTPARRWWLWGWFTLAWTAALLVPLPQQDWDLNSLRLNLKFLVAKGIHVSMYALLALLSGWLRVCLRRRWLLMFFLMAHASVTELLQLVVIHRSGSLTDVLFNHLGIAMGVALSWRWWSAE